MKKILVIHGPNLNLLGKREPAIYGRITLAGLNEMLKAAAKKRGARLVIKQSNLEGRIVDFIQQAKKNKFQGILINPAAYTHTSVAIRDALAGVNIPFVEVHLSNVYKREAFRHHSYLSDLAQGVVAGLGPQGYEAAVRYAVQFVQPV